MKTETIDQENISLNFIYIYYIYLILLIDNDVASTSFAAHIHDDDGSYWETVPNSLEITRKIYFPNQNAK